MSDTRNIGLSGGDPPPPLRLTEGEPDGERVIDAQLVPTRPKRRKRAPLERGMLDRGRNAERLVHELSNLLDGSLRNVGLALRRLDDEPPVADGEADVTDQLKSAEHALRYMAELLHGWQQGGSETPQSAMRRVDLSLGEVVHEVMKLIRPMCEATHITMTTRLSDVVMDEPLGPLYPVLVNGLKNAIEAIGSGGHITLLAQAAGDDVEVRITDDGPGVSDVLDRDGDGLVAAGDSTKGKGHGLGLAISRDVVRAMGGVLRLEDREDGVSGTVLLIRVPVLRDDLHEREER